MRNRTALFLFAAYMAAGAAFAETDENGKQASAGDKSPVINAGGNILVNYGLTKEQFETMLKQQHESIVKELQNIGTVADEKKRFLLERKEKDVQEKLSDIEKSYEEELKKRKSADEALEQLKDLVSSGRAGESVQSSAGSQSPVIHAGGNAIVNYNLTKEEFTAMLQKQYVGLLEDLKMLRSDDVQQRNLLERKLKDVQGKLADIEKSYEEELKKRKSADEALVQLRGQLPEAQIEKAQASLRQGDKEAAKQVFRAVVDKEGAAVALAAYQLGQMAESDLEYAEALRQYKKAVVLEEDNPEYLNAAGKIAWTMGEYRQAEDWFTSLLKIREQGKDDAELGTALNNLALMYKTQGRYSEAEPLYKRDLQISEKSLGKDHPSVATTLNNLAELYRAQGKYKEAEPLYKRSLAISEKSLGKDHPSVAATLNNLAELYRAQGKYEEAEPLHKRSLEIKEKSLGKDHPDVATTLNNLAGLYYKQENYQKSAEMFEQAIAIMKKKFPGGHPHLDLCQKNYDELKQKIAEQK